MTDLERPDPDALLRRVHAEQRAAARGQLKVFFGFAPGVGKTFAMLESARRLEAAGRDLVVGCVETHGRAETAKLLEGLEVLPRRTFEHRGVSLHEFDLDATLKRRPQIVLVDELAHTNSPGARHTHRFQDVLELLDAGIDVHTTLNVQHLESLNDVVRQLTGVPVRETVPDSVLDRADDVELVDLPTDELLERLAQGKVYLPQQAALAAQHFFRPSNLIALRELALRRTAQRVDADLTRLREQQIVHGPSGATDRVLVSIGAAPSSAAVIRAGRRLAEALRAPWSAVWVDAGAPLGADDSARLDEHLRLAESLGASVQRLAATSVGAALAQAIERAGARHVVLGSPVRRRLRDRLTPSVLDEMLALRPDVQVHLVSGLGETAVRAPTRPAHAESSWPGVVAAVLITAIVTAAGLAAQRVFTLQDQVMLYLLGIMMVAARFTRTAAIVASALAVAAYDFFFIPPTLTFSVSDARHALTFIVMFVVALLISGLTLRLRHSELSAKSREGRTAALYALSRELTQARTADSVAEVLALRARELFGFDVGVVLDPHHAALVVHSSRSFEFGPSERAVVRWVLDHGREAGRGTDTLPGATITAFPIGGDARLGALLLRPSAPTGLDPASRAFVDAFVQPAALALESVRHAAAAQQAALKARTEELRATLLSTVSHDLRTPLAAITGAASALKDSTANLPEHRRDELLDTIEDESARLERLISNLLEMTRLENGAVVPKRDWVPAEELIGSALGRLERVLGDRPVSVHVAPDVPSLHVDPILFEQLLVNLLENATKYTPEGTPIELGARVTGSHVVVDVSDRGPGVPAQLGERLFEKFVRGPSGRGAGLGLAIARSIATVHHGTLSLHSRAGGGATFTIQLALERPPEGA